MTQKNKIWTKSFIVSLAVLFCAWLGALSWRLSYSLGGVGYFIFWVTLLFLSISKRKIVLNHEYNYLTKSYILLFLFSLVYGILTSALLKTGHTIITFGVEISVYTYNLMIDVPIWMTSYVVFFQADSFEKKRLTNILYIILLFDVVITTYVLNIDPNYARVLSTGASEETYDTYRFWGAMGYELVYSIVIMLPFFFYLGSVYSKKWYILGAASIIYIFSAGFFIAIIAAILNFSLVVLFGNNKKTVRYALLLVLSIAIIYITINLANIGIWLIGVSRHVKNEALSIRFLQMGYMIAYGDRSGDSLQRFDLYYRSINAILHHPIFGQEWFDTTYALSDHSALLDIWGGFGIFPLSLIVLCIRNSYRYCKSVLISFRSKRLLLSAFITLTFISLCNQIFVSAHIMLAIMFVLPLFCVYLSQKEYKLVTEKEP